MLEKDITLLVRRFELDINDRIQEFYNQRPPNTTPLIWAMHNLHAISKSTLNALTTLNEELKKEELT
jgi:hypothetical protein